MAKPLQVAVVYDGRGEKCETECGIDWSSADALTLAKERVKQRFGDKVKLDCIDLSQPDASPELVQLVKKEKLTLPALLINGQPRISGEFDFRLLLDAIDAELEIEREGEADE